MNTADRATERDTSSRSAELPGGKATADLTGGTSFGRGVRGLQTPLVPLGGGSTPIYTRLYQEIRRQILDGRWPAGTRLPSTRLLAEDLGIARGTAALAIDQLVAEGWLVSRPREGVFVPERPAELVEPENGGEPRLTTSRGAACFREVTAPTRIFPVGRWRQHQSRVWNNVDPGELLLAEQDGGHPALRRAIARLACGSRGIPTSDERVVVCSGVRTAVEIAVRSILEPGGRVVMESPGDPQMADRLRRAGYRIISVEVDDEGLRTADLPAEAEAVIVSTALHLATGRSLSGQRRRELLDWASHLGAELIELDCEGHLARSAGKPILPLGAAEAVGRSIYVRDFDRVTYPGLSIAFAVLPTCHADAARSLVRVVDRPLSVADQLVLADFIESGGMARHIRDIACATHAARDALLADLLPHRGSLFEDISAGGSVLHLKPRQKLSKHIARALEEAGLVVWGMQELSLRLPSEGDELGVATLGPAAGGVDLRQLSDAALPN